MNSLDANVVLRYILRDIPEQSRKAEALINNSFCYVSGVIVTEIAFVLEKVMEVPRADIGKLLRKFLALKTIRYDEQPLNSAIDLYEVKSKLSFPDCYAAVEAEQSGNTLVTFDKDLIKHGGSHVTEP